MQTPKFSTVVNAGGFEMVVKGTMVAVKDAIVRGYERLSRVSGLQRHNAICRIETLPRTGDNIRLRITWQQNARA